MFKNTTLIFKVVSTLIVILPGCFHTKIISLQCSHRPDTGGIPSHFYMAAQHEAPEKGRLDIGNGSWYFVSICPDAFCETSSKLIRSSAMIATIVKTIQLKSLGAKADYTCKLCDWNLLNLV